MERPIPALIRERQETATQPGELKVYYDPAAFEWYRRQSGSPTAPFVSVGNKEIYISAPALELTDWVLQDCISVGINRKYIVFRKDREGYRLRESGCRGYRITKPKALSIGRVKKITVAWDGNMLVGRLPEEAQEVL